MSMSEALGPVELDAGEVVNLLMPEFIEVVLQWLLIGRGLAVYQNPTGRHKYLSCSHEPLEHLPPWADEDNDGYRLIGVYQFPDVTT
jgi:hypothetical protein